METKKVFGGFAELAANKEFCNKIMTAEEKDQAKEIKAAGRKAYHEAYTRAISEINNAYVEGIRSKYDLGFAYAQEKEQKLASLLADKMEEYFQEDANDTELACVHINTTIRGVLGEHHFEGSIAESQDGFTVVTINNKDVMFTGEPDVDALAKDLLK